MSSEMRTSPSRWYKLRQLWRFANDGKPCRLANHRPFGPAFRFSARLGWPGWGTQTCQQFGDPTSHVLRGRWAMLAFPRTQFCFDQITGQHQMIVGHGDDLAPALKLLRSAQAG